MRESKFEKGLLAIRLLKMALATDPKLSLEDEHNQQLKRAWGLSKKLLSAEEIEAFGEVLRQRLD